MINLDWLISLVARPQYHLYTSCSTWLELLENLPSLILPPSPALMVSADPAVRAVSVLVTQVGGAAGVSWLLVWQLQSYIHVSPVHPDTSLPAPAVVVVPTLPTGPVGVEQHQPLSLSSCLSWAEWTTLICREALRYCALIGWNHSVATPALLCHKGTAQGTHNAGKGSVTGAGVSNIIISPIIINNYF